MVNTVLTVFVAFVGLLLAGIGLAVLVWFLWWLWKRSEDQKQDLGIEIRAEEAETDATLPVAAAVAAEPDAKVEVQDLEIEAEAPSVGVEARDPEVVVEAPDVEVEADLPEIEAELPEAEIEPPKPDNLQRIDGIGPKLSSVLQAGGITTFAALANADDGQIRQILEDADPRLLRLLYSSKLRTPTWLNRL